IINKETPGLWILFGVVTGVGLLNKYTMLLFGFGIAVGFLLTPLRKYYKNKWLWIAALIALFIWLPNLIWQNQTGWPFFEHMRVLARTQLSNMNPLVFLLTQILMIFYAAPIWLIGLFSLFFSRQFQPYRIIGWIYLSILIVLLLLSGKIYYLAPAYPMLLAAGAVAIERYVVKTRKNWLKPISLAVIILGGMTLIPVGLPVFSVQNSIRYFSFGARYMGIGEALRWETGKFHELPQDYADMLGWEEMVAAVAKTYYCLPEDERKNCAVFASNYGEAGAIDYYGSRYGLPPCISKGGSFWDWGYRNYNGKSVIIAGFNKEDVLCFYHNAETGATFTYPHARESGMPIFIGRDPKMTIAQVWQILKQYRF
ncbi:MAG: glycosyltransferase family 39 protein, partial [Calditrichota bacterium]